MSNPELKPWARGPFELIRHADGHLRSGGDTDRRVALIGFDNAIEGSIDVFIRLHPKLRRGFEIKNEDTEKALRNYHTKIEFLDSYVSTHKLHLDVPIEVIVWYHSLRNELYHSGNGMVPEIHVVEGARAAALATFRALFGVDGSVLLGQGGAESQVVETVPYLGQNDQMEFLRIFIDFERTLHTILHKLNPTLDPKRTAGVSTYWNELANLRPLPPVWERPRTGV